MIGAVEGIQSKICKWAQNSPRFNQIFDSHLKVMPLPIREAMFAMFSAHMLREWAWPCAHMNVTTFNRFAHNFNIGSLLVFYGSV